MSDVVYDVPLIPQPDKLSCWAGSMAMLLGFRRQASYPPEQLANDVGMSLRTSYGWDLLEAVKNRFGFVDVPLPFNASLYPSPDQWASWLTPNDRVYLTRFRPPSHAIIVRDITGDLTPAGTQMLINNPWDTGTTFTGDPIDFSLANVGIAYQQTFADLASDFGNLALSDYGSWRVLYLASQ